MIDNTVDMNTRYEKSEASHRSARSLMPGGVSSPVRAFKAVGGTPVTVRSGQGAVVTDIDGNAYIDYIGSYGPLILGHSPEPVLAAINKAAARGTSFGMPTELETVLAQLIVDLVPSVKCVRFVNSGTEAVMSAIRLARSATGRPRIIKCTGCYHGHSDSLLVQAGSGAATLGTPSSAGVPESIVSNTVLVPYNDPPSVEAAFTRYPDEIAAMIVEPVAGNMGCVLPRDGYLSELRRLCDQYNALLIFDEVMTGFRLASGGAQQRYGVMPDLTCLGKVMGGGMPCAAYGGSEKIMRLVAPDGPMYQAGTLSGNPLAMAAGIATLEVLTDPGVYDQLEARTAQLESGLAQAAAMAGCPVSIALAGSMLCCFFSDNPVRNFEQATACRTDRFTAFFHAMLDSGIMIPPSQYECWFVSTAHEEPLISRTIEAAEPAFSAAARID